MKNLSLGMAGKILLRGLRNCLTHKPLAVSFEITHSCNANCRHCDKGGIRDEKLATPEQYRLIYEEIKPIIAQISGGEPLLRHDVLDIVRILKSSHSPPYIVLVTNGSLLTVGKYLQLREAGVDEFAISLDFPDDRHDSNRSIPGLYRHLAKLLPQISTMGYKDVTLVTAVTRENFPYLYDIVKKAKEWGVSVNFSAYTKLRTGNPEFFITSAEELALFRRTVNKLIEEKRKDSSIFTTEYVLRRSAEFFENGGIPGCRAGQRSLVINPDGSMSPCAMKKELRYRSQKELIAGFSKNNRCGGCYVSLRANTDKSIWQMFKDNVFAYASVKWKGLRG